MRGKDWLLGDFTAADIQMSFVGEVAQSFGVRAAHPELDRWSRACQARPAYKRALERGGPYRLAG